MHIAIHHLKNFEPRPNSRALSTVGSVMTIGLSIIGCAHSKNRFDVRRQGTLAIQPKLSKIWKQRQMVQIFPTKVSRNSESCWISKMRILEIPGAKLNGEKTSLKSFFENLGIPHDVGLFFGILENVVSFASGSCQKFKPDVLVEWEAAKIDWSRRLGCGDFRGLTRLKQSLLFSSSLKKRVWRVHKFGLRWLQRLDAIKAEPPFLLLTQQTGLTSPKDWAAATSEAWRD